MPDGQTSGPAPRYHALDGLRVAAMLLGVAWHAEPWFDWRPVSAFMDWLHSFRMPLFLLISGFFGALMVAKYGARGYLARRWWRIGAPLLIGLFTFTPIDHEIGILADRDPAPGAAESPSPEVEFESSLVAQEWLETVEAARGLVDADEPGPGVPAEIPANPDRLNRRIFGAYGGFITLGHLWFLWYLLVFVTVAPPAARLAGWARRRAGRAGGRAPIGLAPAVLGLVTFPCLMQMPGFGWGLGLATGIDGLFPDFLFQYQPDWPFYFAYFLAGWWLFRHRDRLPDVGRTWLPALACGVAAYGVARLAYGRFSTRTDLPGYAWIRLGGYGLSAAATACTSWGMVGLFQLATARPGPAATSPSWPCGSTWSTRICSGRSRAGSGPWG